MKLHLSNAEDGHMLWGVFLDGRRNDGDGGIEIHHEWFMFARTEAEVRDALGDTVKATVSRYTYWYNPPVIVYRPVSPSELVICSRQPGGRLKQVTLDGKSAPGFSLTSALMDTRG